MQFENILKFHRCFSHLITEEDVLQSDCISVVDSNNIEQKIYLAKVEDEFEVRIYKANPQDTYVPSKLDFQVKRYESNDEFDCFFFDRFFFARRFISTLRDVHPEYSLHPI